MPVKELIHSFSFDCRGAGPELKILNRNDVVITKIIEEDVMDSVMYNKKIEVSCNYMSGDTRGNCIVGQRSCPHLHPKSSRI